MSRIVLAGLLLAAALTGCADDGGVPPIAPDDLAAEISSRMEEEVGVAPEVDCPAELSAEVGATATCTIAASEEVTTALVVEATVTEIDEAERVVMFDIAVSTAEEASPDPSAPAEETPVEETPAEESPPAPEEAAEETTEPTP